MNLNFYQPGNNDYLENLRNTLNDNLNKLDQLRNINLSAMQPQQQPSVSQPLQPQRYYLDCGVKEEWEEFLKINYNISEQQIFDDYRLFLQAKSELKETANKEKLEIMKQRIAPETKIKEKGNVGNNTNVANQSFNGNSKQSMENNNNNVQNKGVKYAR